MLNKKILLSVIGLGMSLASLPSLANLDYGPWVDIKKWDHCANMVKRGNVFELQNAEGQSILSECTADLPEVPFDWKSGAVRFRLVKEPNNGHSTPMPEHKGKGKN